MLVGYRERPCIRWLQGLHYQQFQLFKKWMLDSIPLCHILNTSESLIMKSLPPPYTLTPTVANIIPMGPLSAGRSSFQMPFGAYGTHSAIPVVTLVHLKLQNTAIYLLGLTIFAWNRLKTPHLSTQVTSSYPRDSLTTSRSSPNAPNHHLFTYKQASKLYSRRLPALYEWLHANSTRAGNIRVANNLVIYPLRCNTHAISIPAGNIFLW
jgi:hypothetical protein